MEQFFKFKDEEEFELSVHIADLVDELKELLSEAKAWEVANGNPIISEYPQYAAIRKIGQEFHGYGGLEEMEYYHFLCATAYKTDGRLLSTFWNGIGDWFKSDNIKNDPDKIIEYWEASNKTACGNCMHFSFPVVGEPICAIPAFLIPEGCPKEKIRSGNKVKPEDSCLLWAKRQGGL